MNRIKMIGVDLDGTVLNAEKKISEKNKEVFALCKKRGIYVVPVTGRPYSGIYDEYKNAMRCDYTINTNGAAAIDVKSDRRIISHTMDVKTSFSVMDALKEYDCYYGVFCDGFGYLKEEHLEREKRNHINTPIYDYILKTRRTLKDYYEFVKNAGECDNIYVMAKNSGIRGEICEVIKDIKNIYFTCSDYNDVEIGGNCSKGATLLELAAYLNVSPDEVMAIGDSGNDINMLESAGLSVAMENASDEVKKVSDYITKSNEENGVAYAVEKFVL